MLFTQNDATLFCCLCCFGLRPVLLYFTFVLYFLILHNGYTRSILDRRTTNCQDRLPLHATHVIICYLPVQTTADMNIRLRLWSS